MWIVNRSTFDIQQQQKMKYAHLIFSSIYSVLKGYGPIQIDTSSFSSCNFFHVAVDFSFIWCMLWIKVPWYAINNEFLRYIVQCDVQYIPPAQQQQQQQRSLVRAYGMDNIQSIDAHQQIQAHTPTKTILTPTMK